MALEPKIQLLSVFSKILAYDDSIRLLNVLVEISPTNSQKTPIQYLLQFTSYMPISMNPWKRGFIMYFGANFSWVFRNMVSENWHTGLKYHEFTMCEEKMMH